MSARSFVLTTLTVVAGLFCVWLFSRVRGQPSPVAKSTPVAVLRSESARTSNEAMTAPPTGAAVRTGGTLAASLRELRLRLAAGVSPDAARDELALIADLLQAASPDEAVAALRAMLDGGMDAPTGLAFKIGAGGDLTAAPTLRVWMLDQLGRLDAAAAARYAATIYARHDSADEWAIALRNDWRLAAPTGRIEAVRARALELLADEEWAGQPSVGFLQALDFSVATLAWEAVPRLEQWLAHGQPPSLRTGAWVALDRLTMEMPEDFLPALAQRPEWLGSQPIVRAGLMARADLRMERERSAVETYLQRDDVGASEGRRFFEMLPNVSATVSYNLATTSRPPTPQGAAELDQAALAGVRAWRTQAKFPRWEAELAAAENRLVESVASAIRGGYLKP